MKTIKNILKSKSDKKLITSLTAYDFFTANIAKLSSPDFILVGDSLNMVCANERSTISATMDQMIYHASIVTKTVADTQIPVIGDMPFLSFHLSDEKSLENAATLFIKGNLDGVKIEGARFSTIKNIVDNGIPVMGHIGLKPQSVHAEAGYKVYGRTENQAKQLVEDAIKLQEAGVFSLVLEGVMENVAKEITEKLSIPTIGIGAGRFTDGQILVTNDILGMTGTLPKFVRQYQDFTNLGVEALSKWIDDVKEGSFPSTEEIY